MSPVKVTFLLFSYNHERFLADAMQSIVRQTRPPDEIILCDDGSRDRSREILQAFARTLPATQPVKLLLSETNRGLSRTINEAFALATGELWVLLAGDDYAREDRVEQVIAAYGASGRKARSICSNAEVIDAVGKQEGLYFPKGHRESYQLEVLAAGNNGVLGATQSIHREVWDVFRGLPPDVYQEDVLLPFRAALLGGVVYLEEPLVYYRHHGANVHFAGLNPRQSQALVLSRDRLERWLRNTIATARARLADLRVAGALGRIPADQAKRLGLACERSLRDAELEHGIGMAERRRIPGLIGGAFLQGVSFSRCARMALFYLCTPGYAAILNLWIRFGQMKTRLRSFLGAKTNIPRQ